MTGMYSLLQKHVQQSENVCLALAGENEGLKKRVAELERENDTLRDELEKAQAGPTTPTLVNKVQELRNLVRAGRATDAKNILDDQLLWPDLDKWMVESLSCERQGEDESDPIKEARHHVSTIRAKMDKQAEFWSSTILYNVLKSTLDTCLVAKSKAVVRHSIDSSAWHEAKSRTESAPIVRATGADLGVRGIPLAEWVDGPDADLEPVCLNPADARKDDGRRLKPSEGAVVISRTARSRTPTAISQRSSRPSSISLTTTCPTTRPSQGCLTSCSRNGPPATKPGRRERATSTSRG